MSIVINEGQHSELLTKGTVSLSSVKDISIGDLTTFDGYDSANVFCVGITGIVIHMAYEEENENYKIVVAVTKSFIVNYENEDEYDITHHITVDKKTVEKIKAYKVIEGAEKARDFKPNDIVKFKEVNINYKQVSEEIFKVKTVNLERDNSISVVLI